MKSANDGYNNILANACPTTSANDMVVSDDDSATAQNKNLKNASYFESFILHIFVMLRYFYQSEPRQ